MKKAFTTILALVLLFALCACGMEDITDSLRTVTDSVAPTAEPTPEPTPAPTPEPTPAPTPEPAAPEHPFKAILDLYYTALSEGWGPSAMMENGLNYMLAYSEGDALQNIGFYVADMDGDGVEELAIGDRSENPFLLNMVYEFYVLQGDEAVERMSSSERNRYYFCDDNTVINVGSSNAMHSVTVYYRLENSDLCYLDAVIFDSKADPDHSWFYTTDPGTDIPGSKPLSSDEATKLIEDHEAHVTRLPYTPFAEYPDYSWES